MRPRVIGRSADGALRLVLRPAADGVVVAFRFVDASGRKVRGAVPLEQLDGRWGTWRAALSAAPPPSEPPVS